MSIAALQGTDITTEGLKIVIAYVLGVPTGWERFKHDRSAGLRTFPLVALASCAFMLAGEQGSNADTKARILVGVMTGIGFIGGGSILKEAASVHGTATAASLWNMGAIGASVAYGNFGLALILCIINYLSLLFLTPFEERLKQNGNNHT